MTATIWSGYTFPVSGVTGVRAQWTQPPATGQADAHVYVWIGVGGWNQPSLIQAGTDGSPSDAARFAWYELLPAGPETLPVTSIPGDKIAVSIVQLRQPRENWQITVYDLTGGQSFTQVVQYDSAGTYPSFIIEDPSEGSSPTSPITPFSHWGSISFSNMQIRIGGTWKPAASVFGYQIQMIRDGRTLVTTGPLDKASGFTAHQES